MTRLWIGFSGAISATAWRCRGLPVRASASWCYIGSPPTLRPTRFLKHEHIGGEFYLVLKGKIADETGEYEKGEIVFLDPQSVHTPFAIGETVVLVLWPAGVRLVD